MEELELNRKKSNRYGIIGVILLIASIALAFLVTPFFAIGAVVAVVLLIIASSIKNKVTRQLLAKFKEDFENRYPGYTYDRHGGIDIRRIYDGGLVCKQADIYKTEDLITAKFDNGVVSSADVHMIEVREYRDSKGNRRTEQITFFLGRYYIFDFNKHDFNFILTCFEKGLRYVDVKGLNRCETESIAFNERYKTFTDNQLELYKFLKPQVIEKLTELERKYKGSIGISVYQNQIHIAVYNNRDSMELNNIGKINEDNFNSYLTRIHDEIEGMIEIFDANSVEYSK